MVAAGRSSTAPWYHATNTIYAIGRNYVAHAKELGNAVPTAPFWFLKPKAALIGSGEPHHCFPGIDETHHELELGVVIGKQGSRVHLFIVAGRDHERTYYLPDLGHTWS